MTPTSRIPRPDITRRTLLRGSGAALFGAALLGGGSTLLSACGSDGAETAAKELTFWNFQGPNQDTPASNWFVSIVDAWNKNNDVQIKLHYVPVSDYVNGTALQTAFASGQGPDIFMVSPGDFLRYANGGVLADLSPQLSAEAKADFIPGALDTRIVDDKVLALPMEVAPMAMYYSVPAFESAGLSEADLPVTWDQMLDVAGKLTTTERFGVLFETIPGYYQNFTWYPFMWSGGGMAVTPDGKTSAFDSPAVVAALEVWQQTIELGLAPRKAQGNGGSDIIPNMVAGLAGMQHSGIWSVSDMRKKAADYEYGVMRTPIPTGGTYTTDMGGWAFAANAKGSNPEVAAEFVVWALAGTDTDGVERMRQWNTEVDSNVPARTLVTAAADQAGAFADPAMQTFVTEIAPGGRAEPRYTPEVYQAVSDAIQAAQLGGVDPAQAAADADAKIAEFLESYDGAPIF